MRAELERQAQALASEFMSTRSIRKQASGDWSDLTLRVKVRDGRLVIEWRKRVWLNRASAGSGKGYRYVPKHLSARALLPSAKTWEREEVIWTRDRLNALLKSHRAILRMESGLARLGLTGDEADLVAGFVPAGTSRPRTSGGRFIASHPAQPVSDDAPSQDADAAGDDEA